MFLEDKTGFDVKMTRSCLGEAQGFCCITVEALIHHRDPRFPVPVPSGFVRPMDWPAPLARRPLLRGTSVTASGDVLGTPPYVNTVELRLGSAREEVVVCGPRVWGRDRAGTLVPSAPNPFERLALDYRSAFGGSIVVPPGIDANTGLPHPGITLMWPYNPEGVGFYRTEAEAEGKPLPGIERKNDRTTQWGRRPTPGGLGPCLHLPGLRRRSLKGVIVPCAEDVIRSQHHAPYPLVSMAAVEDCNVSLIGCGQPIEHAIPSAPVRATAKSKGRSHAMRFVACAVHVDARASVTFVTYQAAVRYALTARPRVVQLQAA